MQGKKKTIVLHKHNWNAIPKNSSAYIHTPLLYWWHNEKLWRIPNAIPQKRQVANLSFLVCFFTVNGNLYSRIHSSPPRDQPIRT
jgi:hypothetical protein